ncbi:RNA-binding protein [Rhizobium sp. L1K21]|uniref:RNA-binding protein n=1 Tax=Rhizobium sp. L1K21 TaxID=2954933 RepID=UPI002091FF3C|nr:RNA-binding protein [Rhizobium sp. L1K21]MCO6184777.1 RNA-binding protein [Rhizobium sp. L1K21]
MKEDMNDRTCIVTRESGSAEELIRFVAGPDGAVVPDLKRKLPGRGCWVKAEKSVLEIAIRKNHFSRALKEKVTVDPALAEQVESLMVSDLAGMMNLARKAGQFVSGAMKVDNAVRSGEAMAVFHAQDAAADGIRKVDQARKAFHLTMETEAEIPSFQPFEPAEMEKLMGENAFKHACALAGQAGEGVVKRAKVLKRYRDGRET